MILINETKAIEITKEKIRAWRNKQFKDNDLAIQNALLEGLDTTSLIERRNYLRDLPSKCDGKTVDQLKMILQNLK